MVEFCLKLCLQIKALGRLRTGSGARARALPGGLLPTPPPPAQPCQSPSFVASRADPSQLPWGHGYFLQNPGSVNSPHQRSSFL